MGGGSIYDIKGIGRVKINMFGRVVCTLDSVTYVSKMRKNLISLDRLNFMGYMYSITGGHMKITHDYLVLMKGEKCDDLYHLIGNTVINGVLLTLMES